MRSHMRAVYVISVAAELAGMHAQTLRDYERKGFINPARTEGGSRRYSDADIALLARVHELTESGLNLEGVRRVLALEAEISRLEQELELARLTSAALVAETHKTYRRDLVPLRQSVAVFSPR